MAGDMFSVSTKFNVLPLPYPKEISDLIPPPGFASRASATDLHAQLFNLMTSCEGVSDFKEIISELDRTQLHTLASLLTSDLDYFMTIVTNKYGSRRVQNLLETSDDVDMFLCAAILRRFLRMSTDKYASDVVLQAMTVFDKEKKEAMYEHILYHALDIACDQHGCITLNDMINDIACDQHGCIALYDIITAADDPYYRDQILDLVTRNVLRLSNDASGNFVVQHVLSLSSSRGMYNIAVNLRGHCIELSFKKYGSYIVKKLLQGHESKVVVVAELLGCDGDRLLRLARNEFGNLVLSHALKWTAVATVDLHFHLLRKLKPFLHLVRWSH